VRIVAHTILSAFLTDLRCGITTMSEPRTSVFRSNVRNAISNASSNSSKCALQSAQHGFDFRVPNSLAKHSFNWNSSRGIGGKNSNVRHAPQSRASQFALCTFKLSSRTTRPPPTSAPRLGSHTPQRLAGHRFFQQPTRP